MAKVTVILPVYNGEKTLRQTIDSLFAQTYKNFEIVACIDGSNDGSLQILNSYGDRVKVIRNEVNLGLARTLNRLMYYVPVDCEYIAMAEQDDFYYPYRLEKQVKCLDDNLDYGLVSGVAEFWSGDGRKITLFPGLLANKANYPTDNKEMFLLNYKHQIKVVNTCMMFRKSIYKDYGLYFDAHFPNVSIDWAFVLRFSYFSKIYGLSDILARMDRRPSRDSITMNKKKQYKTAHELLRFFRFERADYIDKTVYKYAWTTQKLMELGQYKFLERLMRLSGLLLNNPRDKRVRESMCKHLKRLLSR